MALLKVLSDRNEHLQQVGILNEDLVWSRRLATFLDHKLIAPPLFGAHLIDWNLGIPTEGAEIRGFLVQCGLSHDGLSFLCDICLLVRRQRLKRIEHCRG
jgi:hypothetical protein